jgi:predicted acylesterase/phospholipase RssA
MRRLKRKELISAAGRVELPNYDVVALVLQGGGALGAYQAGVYEGLHEAGIRPNWVAGISIGALNAAIIAGSPESQRVDRCASSGKPSAHHRLNGLRMKASPTPCRSQWICARPTTSARP